MAASIDTIQTTLPERWKRRLKAAAGARMKVLRLDDRDYDFLKAHAEKIIAKRAIKEPVEMRFRQMQIIRKNDYPMPD